MYINDIEKLSRAELNYLQFIATCRLYYQTPVHATLFSINSKRLGLMLIKQKDTNPENSSTKTMKLPIEEMKEVVHFLKKDYPDLTFVDTTANTTIK